MEKDPLRHDPYSSLRNSGYRRFLLGSHARILGDAAIRVAVGYQLYERTGSALALALIGLSNYLPVFLLSLPAGFLADHADRRRILRITTFSGMLCALGMAALALMGVPEWPWYVLLLLLASARAIHTPASASFYPSLMKESEVPNAVSWASANYQLGLTLGPALGGLLVHFWGVEKALAFAALGYLTYFLTLAGIRPLRKPKPNFSTEPIRQRLAQGLRFVFKEKTIFGALSLDFVAVLFGGVEGIMPLFAKDILHVGAWGLGLLQAAPFAGAFLMSWMLAHRRPMQRPGRAMLLAVAGFGLCMGSFGFSKSFALSLALLFVGGLLDQVSVWVRQTLVQLRTPDRLRGRVQAVNFLFIGSSNELGEFESGVAANWLGAVPSVALGGVAVLAAVCGGAFFFPQLLGLKELRPGPKA